jgi:hypothetical protein
MTISKKFCACGCGQTTTTTPQGLHRTYIRGHNRRGVGKGWIEGGYRYLYVEDAKIAEHRHVVEQNLGRKLGSNEVVHHVNGNKLDNALVNLVVLSRSEHQRLHGCSSRRPWKVEETRRALALRKAGLRIWEIALVLGRPFSTTARRLAKLTKESRFHEPGVEEC